jgi:hypothetical protein
VAKINSHNDIVQVVKTRGMAKTIINTYNELKTKDGRD